MTETKVCKHTKPEQAEFIKKMAADSSLFAGEVESITYMPGGLTNNNFKTVVDGKTYAFRIAGEGTAEYLNRPGERQAVHALKDLGISPEFYYYDLATGSNICRFCEGPTMKRDDFQTRSEILEKAAAILKKFHNSGIQQKGTFDPMAEINSYIQWLKDNNCTKYYDGMDVLVKTLETIDAQFAKNPPKKVFSHNDVLSENFIYDDINDKLELIDWEYCGMNVYNFDVAAIIIENKLDDKKEAEFLKYYYETDELSERDKADVLIGKFLVDALWCPWALVQLVSKPAEEEFYWQYGLERITRCNQYMADPNFQRYVAMLAE